MKQVICLLLATLVCFQLLSTTAAAYESASAGIDTAESGTTLEVRSSDADPATDLTTVYDPEKLGIIRKLVDELASGESSNNGSDDGESGTTYTISTGSLPVSDGDPATNLTDVYEKGSSV